MSRCGIPEIVYCRGKSVEAIASACERLAGKSVRAIATRCEEGAANQVRDLLELQDFTVTREVDAMAIIVAGPESSEPAESGSVGLLTAGTADWPVAAEAQLIAREAGCAVHVFRDVGVAGLHRLVKPLETLKALDVDVIIVAAGMDGVLPAVVAGLVDVPVIGLPTSVGYGLGAGGVGALTAMLQSCAPGLVVVNIDNGIGAGSTAALIANRAASSRQI